MMYFVFYRIKMRYIIGMEKSQYFNRTYNRHW
jgi:hypothetical protein